MPAEIHNASPMNDVFGSFRMHHHQLLRSYDSGFDRKFVSSCYQLPVDDEPQYEPLRTQLTTTKSFPLRSREGSQRILRQTNDEMPQHDHPSDHHQNDNEEEAAPMRRQPVPVSSLSPSFPKSSSAIKKRPRPGKFVRFNNDTVVIDTLGRDDYTPREMADAYYNNDEIHAIQRHCIQCVRKIVRDEETGLAAQTGRRVCGRGLEKLLERYLDGVSNVVVTTEEDGTYNVSVKQQQYLHKTNQEEYRRNREAVLTVLEAHRFNDAETVAMIAQATSEPFVAEARTQGLADAEAGYNQ